MKSLTSGSPFSGGTSDWVTTEQQQKEEETAMTPEWDNLHGSDVLIRTEQWIQEKREGRIPSTVPHNSGPTPT